MLPSEPITPSGTPTTEPAAPAPSDVPASGPAITVTGPRRGPGGKFLPRSAQAEGEAGTQAGEVAAQVSRTAHAQSKNIRVKAAKPAKNLERTAAARARREVQQQAAQACAAIVQMMVTVVKVSLGDECEPSPALRARIEEPGTRILERMDPGSLEMVAKYSDPLQLTMALSEWGMQCFRVYQEKVRLAREEAAAQKDPGREKPRIEEPLPAPPAARAEAEPELEPLPGGEEPAGEPGPMELEHRPISKAEIAEQMMPA